MHINELISCIKQYLPTLQGIYLFGSAASGQQGPDSDLDIAVLLPHPLDNLQRWEIAQKLASQRQQDVDLIALRSASTVLQFQIVSTGERIFAADEALCDHFENLVYSMYLQLNQERAGIMEDIQRRGTVYG